MYALMKPSPELPISAVKPPTEYIWNIPLELMHLKEKRREIALKQQNGGTRNGIR